MKLRSIVFSWDFLLPLATSILVILFLPSNINTELVKDFYSIGISVLSIVFSVFFAALAIIISSGDNDFIKFLEEDGLYSMIINSFKYSILLLFIALIYSIILYGVTSNQIVNQIFDQSKCFLALFIFLFFYGLCASASSTFDSIRYAKYRAKYTLLNKNKDKNV